MTEKQENRRKTGLKRAKVSTFDVIVVPHHSFHVSSGTGAR